MSSKNIIVITKSNPEYDQVRLNWDTRFQFFPKKIIQPLNTKGVQETLKYVLRRKYEFAIRSGKHCFEPWSLTNGILIDLSKLNNICLNEKTGIATIGAGAILGDIYKELLSKNVMIPAGTRPTVGIGGQALGGGVGYSTRAYGLLIDSVLECKVVLADGKVVTASKTENKDLFWALRGAGAGNFGIVIEYQVQTYPAPKVTVFTYNYPLDKTGKDALKWLTSVENDEKLTAQGVITKDGFKLTGQYFGKLSELLEEISCLPEPDTSEFKYIPFAGAVEYWSAPTQYQSAKAKSRFNSGVLPNKVINKLFKTVQKIETGTDVKFSIGIQQLRGKATGSIPWKKSTYWVNWVLRWNSGPEPDAKILEDSYQSVIDSFQPLSYMGMMDEEVAPPEYQQAYYGDNYERLLKIKDKYDPDHVFKYPQGLVQ